MPGPMLDARAVRTVVTLVVALAAAACAPRPRMCAATTECATESACVAGRCQSERASVRPAIDVARRIVARPVEVGVVRRGADAAEGLPPAVTLGEDDAKLFLRFTVALPPTANVVEAYVVLRRSLAVDGEGAPIGLHATRIVDGWRGGSMAWSLQPRTAASRAPMTLVRPGGPSLVRVDVREFVQDWAKHRGDDHGLAIVAEESALRGTRFALGAAEGETSPSGAPAADAEPYLELYVR